MSFDGNQLRSMSTHGFPTNDMVNPWQNNKQYFPFIAEKICISLQVVLGRNLILCCLGPSLVKFQSKTREIIKRNVLFPELDEGLT